MITICIPTVIGREAEYNRLVSCIKSQDENVIILTEKDNKEISIGAKRQILLDKVQTAYFVMIDDDDMIPDYYLEEVYKALEEQPDCVCYLEQAIMDGKEFKVCHSNRFNDWGSGGGYNFIRTPFYKDVLRTDIAKQIGFKDLRYGEDHDFARRLKKSGLIQKEVFINKYMYLYSSTTLNAKQHNERYGIR